MVEWYQDSVEHCRREHTFANDSMLTLAILDRIPDHSIIVRQPITPDLV